MSGCGACTQKRWLYGHADGWRRHQTAAAPSPAAATAPRRAARTTSGRPPAAKAQRAHGEVEAEHGVLVVEADAEQLLDAVQPQVQRLALEVQRAGRLGLATAAGQERLERLQQRAAAGGAVGQQRAELLV